MISMKIFQGKQAEQIEANVEYLELALGILRSKGPVDERMANCVKEVIAQSRLLENLARELPKWKGPIMKVARATADLREMAICEIEHESEYLCKRRDR